VAGNPDYQAGAIWSTDGTNPWEMTCNDINARVNAMQEYGGAMYVAGSFTEVGTHLNNGGVPSSYFGYFSRSVTGIEPVPVSARARLHQNEPNPFNPSTTIRYEVPAGGAEIRLVIYDVQGRLVRTLVSAFATPGPKRVRWDGRNDAGDIVSSSVYFYQLKVDGTVLTRKMVMLK
jgi:hypothetical protein